MAAANGDCYSDSSFLSLPDELLLAISWQLEGVDIKSLRLTCRRTHSITSNLLFHRVFLSSHPLDLKVFETVASNPLLCSGVEELVWDDTTFPSTEKSSSVFFTAALCRPRAMWKRFHPSQQAYEHWLSTATKHHQIRKLHQDQTLLVNTLPDLCRLQRVVLTNRGVDSVPQRSEESDGLSPTVRQWYQWSSPVPFPPHVRWGYRRGPDFADDLDKALCLDWEPTAQPPRLMDFSSNVMVADSLGFYPADLPCLFRGLLILLRALEHSDCVIREFIVDPCHNSILNDQVPSGISHWFFCKWHPDLDRMEKLFRNLTKLQLVISTSDHHGQATIDSGHLSRILRAPTKLRQLRLEICNASLTQFLQDAVYPMLESVWLTGTINAIALSGFLDRHRDTVLSVTLEWCLPEHDSWNSVIDELRTGCFELIDFDFQALCGPPFVHAYDKRELNDYLHGRSSKIPSTSMGPRRRFPPFKSIF